MKITKWSGKPITKPGWYSGIPIEKYHSAGICDGLAVSSSDLRTCWSKSPAHMFACWAENPKREERTVTNAMLLGGCAHHLLLGEDNFNTTYVAQPETYNDTKTGETKKWNYNAIACQKWRSQQEKEGRIVTTVKILDAIVGMSKSLALEATIDDLMRGHIETSGFFKHRETGLWIKVRPDVIPANDDTFIDLKTASEVTQQALMYSIRTYGYHQQGALIWEACEALGHPFSSFTLMFAETTNPYCARAVPLPEEDLALGRLQNQDVLRRIMRCIEANHFPGPGEGEHRSFGLSQDERERIKARLKLAEPAKKLQGVS